MAMITHGPHAICCGLVVLLAACGTPDETTADHSAATSAAISVPPTTAPPTAATLQTAGTPADTTTERDPLMAMQHLPGVSCSRSDSGIQTCTMPGYDVSGMDRACNENDSGFGAVLADGGTTLLDRFPADGAEKVATLMKGQFLCVQFVAESTTGGEGWVYVAAIPPALVERCAGNPACGSTSAIPAWVGAAPAGICATGEEGRYTWACASGWVLRADIDKFPMGLGGAAAGGA